MERVEQYRQSIRQILMSHATFESGNSDIESQLVFDTEHDHYQLLEVGWEGLKRVYTCIIHLDSELPRRKTDEASPFIGNSL